MIDIVFPRENETEFIKLAEKLGLKGVCFVYTEIKESNVVQNNNTKNFQEKTKLQIKTAVLCEPRETGRYIGKIKTIIRAPEEQEKTRQILEQAKPNMVFGLEFGKRKDFLHHKASGLNHVLGEIAREKKITIGFNFSKILNASERDRAVYIGRMMQNIRFARKFGFNTAVGSFANTPWDMRGERETKAFFMSIGMNANEFEKASKGEWLE
jgi:RNase P/RNase MRP subunit p30